jgi:HAE1 family hydrophobic/amphiphilic exporter-1
MNLADLSIKRPVFISCVFVLMLVVGGLSFGKLGVDLFPNVTFPVIGITTTYPGAGPLEIETLVSKPIEDSLSGLSGIKSLKSINKESISQVIIEFTLETDLQYAEQQVRDRLTSVKSKMPDDAEDYIVQSFDPSDQPILSLSIKADLGPAELYDLADQTLRPLIEQVKDVGVVQVVGGRKREVQVLMDQNLLTRRQVSGTQIVNQLAIAGKNVPGGKLENAGTESTIRSMGEFQNLKDIEKTLVNFYGNEQPIQVKDVAQVVDGLEEEKTRMFINGEPTLTLQVYRRSGSNTIAVVQAVKKRVEKINTDLGHQYKNFNVGIVRDDSKPIYANVLDVTESITLGIILTIVVVFLFLGNIRSTVITGVALPNSLLGTFILMAMAGFTINIMTLLAMSLAVGLLIDDAIVVRENIFRHIELGEKPMIAASKGTKEVTLAVVATTFVVISVFGPIAFLKGIVGQFFREFGLTICFAMLISLLDALTMAPMLSAYFAGNLHAKPKTFIGRWLKAGTDLFDRAHHAIENFYEHVIKFTLRRPIMTLFSSLVIFIASFFALSTVPMTFLPAADVGEFVVKLDLPAGTDLETMSKVAESLDQDIRKHKEVRITLTAIGGANGESNEANVYVDMVPYKERKHMNTSQFREIVRELGKKYAHANPRILDVGAFGEEQPFNLNIVGSELEQIEAVSREIVEKIKDHQDLKDVDMSYRAGKPEFRIAPDAARSKLLGINSTLIGQEMRTLVEGTVPAVFREHGKEYDIRVKLREDQKNIKERYNQIYVPNINGRMVKLADVAKPQEVSGPSTINRQDRGRYIQISAGLNPDGKGGLGQVIQDIDKMISTGEVKLPQGVKYEYWGQAQDFQELGQNMMIALILAVLFIYLVLASLYESFITPLTIMLVLPLAVCGAFYGLAIMRSSLDIFSIIGCILLLGIATKNSILLVDYTSQLTKEGMDLSSAIIKAGRTRLRPILMTSIALIAGMLPVAIGLNEASRQRTSMGIAIIGGLISSTVLSLVVVPASYAYMERLRGFITRLFNKVSTTQGE